MGTALSTYAYFSKPAEYQKWRDELYLPSGLVDELHSTERLAIAVTGNSEFMINEAELLISIHYDAPVLVVCLDNQQFGTIRQPQ